MLEPGLAQVLTWNEWLMLAGVAIFVIIAVIVIVETIIIFWKL